MLKVKNKEKNFYDIKIEEKVVPIKIFQDIAIVAVRIKKHRLEDLKKFVCGESLPDSKTLEINIKDTISTSSKMGE
ncbi:hypothetical protein D6827_03810 [Candidatus Parcubacteria bacterium]|nr:MAG: hypothetical protein D6827_03810 [Candidatus Parcubacteria bacterium]